MQKRAPVSFILFCIILGLIVLGIVPGFFMTSVDTPGWYRIVMLLSIAGIILITPTAFIFGLLYKITDRGNKLLNRFGMLGSLSIILLIAGLIVYRTFFYESSGLAMPG